jgi:2-polyprenyl-6-methoxyphenol hydroxylase-like FAD-dependent oxidoreductase
VLHRKLLQRAIDVGVSFCWAARVERTHEQQLTCNAEKVAARWIIGADGQASQIRRWFLPQPPRYESIRFGSRQHFALAPWADFVEVYWANTCQITVTPVGSREICLAVTSRDSHVKVHDALKQVPVLAARVANASPASRERGSATALRRLRRVSNGRCALVGDASGSVDPVTGEGLGLAFRQADALTDALRNNDLQTYALAHEHICRVPRVMARLMLVMDKHPVLRGRALHALASEPRLFSSFLNVHIQAIRPSQFGAANALQFSRLLLAGSPGA